jgi:lipopolysaccharide/colanic/teichoic acid biosynthesis glycosyltransferase/acetyltransferase-like isoleucine patch superfamily enzyme
VRVFPVVIDSVPPFLAEAGPLASLLLVPLGERTLLSELSIALAPLSPSLSVVPSFRWDAEYADAVKGAAAGVEGIVDAEELGRRLATHEPSDVLLIVDPRCYPVSGFDVQSVVAEPGVDPRWVTHLVTLQSTSGSAEECVEVGDDGRVQRIQRYYTSVTWPLTSGHFCTVLPVACTLSARTLPLDSLPALRASLAARGVPSRDVLLGGGAFDLTQERALLALMEQSVTNRAAARRASHPGAAAAARIDPSARLVGPVQVEPGAVVEAGATVVGPALLGRGSRIGSGAVVAQALVAPGVHVPEGAVVRHRVVQRGTFDGASSAHALLQDDIDDGRQPVPALVEDRRGGGRGRIYPVIKRLIDAGCALAGLLVLSPLLLLVAALVKLTSSGPILYADEREGLRGRRFPCWKFRTMAKDANVRQRELAQANKVDGPQFKMDRDPRVTAIGRWLRPTNLDELPQLLNVLLGHMSFVGPRPSPFRENQMCIPWRSARLSVRPGITGLWQVCRHARSAGDFHQWIQYDLIYVGNMSFWIDVKILIATLVTGGGRTHVPLSWILPPERAVGSLPMLTDLG